MCVCVCVWNEFLLFIYLVEGFLLLMETRYTYTYVSSGKERKEGKEKKRKIDRRTER